MLTPEEIAARFDNRIGFHVVSYGIVGLPVYRLTTIALCLLKKKISPIEEFVLRAISVGLKNEDEIAGFLGLDQRIVSICITEFVRTECIKINRAEALGGDILSLTPRGAELVRMQGEVVPREQTIVFYVDGLTRKPKIYNERNIFRKQILRDSAIPDLPAFPSRPPLLKELNLGDIIDVVKFDTGKEESPKQLLKVNSIERVDRQFIEAISLVYKSDSGQDFQVAFAIEGRLSIEHEQAFSRENGIQKVAIFGSLRDKSYLPDLSKSIGADAYQQIDELRRKEIDSDTVETKLRRARGKLAAVRVAEVYSDDSAAVELVKNEVAQTIADAEKSRSALKVRQLAVYEHVPLLTSALNEAKERLVISSPWVRRTVVNNEFMSSIRKALGRGISVYIGIALQEQDGHATKWDNAALADLHKLEKSSPQFHVFNVRSTDARLLIVDRDYFVASTFSWLSHKGDPRKPFREEVGTLVTDPEIVDAVFARVTEMPV